MLQIVVATRIVVSTRVMSLLRILKGLLSPSSSANSLTCKQMRAKYYTYTVLFRGFKGVRFFDMLADARNKCILTVKFRGFKV
jgi:hypothetical protein